MNRLLSLASSLLLPSRFSISASSETSTAELKARKDLALSGSESFSTPSARAQSYMPEATAIQARWNAVEALAHAFSTLLMGIPIVNVENACAGGSTPFHLAWMAVASGMYDCALALGVEDVSDPHTATSLRAFDS